MYKYKHEKLMKLFLTVAGIIGMLSQFVTLYSIENVVLWTRYFGYLRIIIPMCGVIIGCFTLLIAIRPYKPIPLNWVSLLVLTILLFLFATKLGGIVVGIALIINLFDTKEVVEDSY